jgi:two-component system, cell cycle sensor histidine kinase and response regulator CckA
LSTDSRDPGLADAVSALFQQSPTPMWVFDRESLRFMEVNAAAVARYGYTRDQFLGMTIREIRPPEDVPLLMDELAVDRADPELPGTWRHRTADGRTLRVQLSAVNVEWQGRPARVVMVNDVTAWDTLNAQLREEKERFRLMVEGSEQVFFFQHDPQGRFVYVSPSVEKVLGYSPEELVGRTFHSTMVLEDPGAAAVIRNTRIALEAGETLPPYSCQVIHRDNGYRVLEISEKPVLDGDRVTGVSGFARDVTDARSADDKIRRLQRELSAVVDTSPLPIIVVDDHDTVLIWNRAAEALFGWTAEETIGKPYPVRPAEGGEDPALLFQAARDGRMVAGLEITRLSRDGRPLHLQLWNAHLRDDEGRVRGLIGILADITARTQLEAELRQSQKMEAVGRLAGGIAHDFNNLLTVIRGHAEFLLDGLGPDHPNWKDAAEIQVAVDRTAALTRRLLAFSRKQVLAPRIMDVGESIRGMEQLLRRIIGDDVQITTRIADPLHPIRADPGQIEQVLLNLVVNARDAMPGGGAVTVEADTVHLDSGNLTERPSIEPGAFVRLTVTDTGSGIEYADLPHIFDPFFTTKEEGHGTGLGLSTVRGIVDQGGGFVTVVTRLGAGTTFTAHFPAAPVPADGQPDATPAVERAAGSDGPGAGRAILVVEDEDAVRALIEHVLRRSGYQTWGARDGVEARDVIEGRPEPLDAVITDVVMPRMTGIELARWLERKRPGLPVLLLSGYADHEVLNDVLTGQGRRFLPKPFEPRLLLHELEELLRAAHAGPD